MYPKNVNVTLTPATANVFRKFAASTKKRNDARIARLYSQIDWLYNENYDLADMLGSIDDQLSTRNVPDYRYDDANVDAGYALDA